MPSGHWEKRRKLFNSQKGLCAICGNPMGFRPKAGDAMATLDHIRPRSKGGTSANANLRAVHRRCNRERGNNMDDVFVEAVGLIALRWNVKELS